MSNGAKHSIPGPVHVNESSDSCGICRLAQLVSLECSNRCVAAVMGIGFNVVECGVGEDSIAACHDPVDIRLLDQLDPSPWRKRGGDEYHMEYSRPGVRHVYGGVVSGSG